MEVVAAILHEQYDKHYNRGYDLTGGQRFNCSDLADILKTIPGEPINYAPITEQTAKKAFLKSGLQPE
ncbi:MAG TPA: hypothetical protein VFT71_07000 [Candidatus Nitrosocosmicus sp.]|nr:hypothetical protein [Candidatus Nitrosocosmicus sp.]